MKLFLKIIVATGVFLILSCNSKNRRFGSIAWPLDIRQNLPIKQPPTCDTFFYKTLHIELSHEHNIDTSQLALVITSTWPLYSGNYNEKLTIDSIPYCLSDSSSQPLKCYLVDKQNRVSYQFHTERNFNLFDNKVRNIKVQLNSNEIENSGSNMKVAINDGKWVY